MLKADMTHNPRYINKIIENIKKIDSQSIDTCWFTAFHKEDKFCVNPDITIIKIKK